MGSRRVALFSILLAAALIHPASARAGTNGGAAVGVTASGFTIPVGLVPEPDSGAIVLFVDSQYLMYAQRLDRHGKPILPGKGLQVMTYDINGYFSNLIPDGSGGALLAWQTDRGAPGKGIPVQRVLSNGTLGYTASGLVVCNASGTQTYPQLIASTSGNYFVVWDDQRSGTQDEFYAQRLTAAGKAPE